MLNLDEPLFCLLIPVLKGGIYLIHEYMITRKKMCNCKTIMFQKGTHIFRSLIYALQTELELIKQTSL